MQSKIQLTEDGSHTLYVPQIDESYHSSHGAIQESMHIFINAGLRACEKTEIQVLEIGFGTGLNAFLTLIEAGKTQKKISFHSLELYPLEIEKITKLNYPELLNYDRSLFQKMHTAEWNRLSALTDYFSLQKTKADFTTFAHFLQYDLIYFDAFSPEKQAEMWRSEKFKVLFEHSNENAIICTYCAKGNVRRAMQAAGFVVERLPGPPGKREFLRGRKQSISNQL